MHLIFFYSHFHREEVRVVSYHFNFDHLYNCLVYAKFPKKKFPYFNLIGYVNNLMHKKA